MLLTIRAGRSSRPPASFVRLAKHRAHRGQSPAVSTKQCRPYATNAAVTEEIAVDAEGTLSSM